MLDYRGYVAEATGANVFFVKDGVIHTPTPDCFLDGITRRTVIGLADDKGFEVVERHIKPEELSTFSECFVTGTAAEVTPVLGDRRVPLHAGQHLAQPDGRLRQAGAARADRGGLAALPISIPQRVDQQGERRGVLAAAGVVEVVAGEGRAPVLEHADQPAVGDAGRYVVVGQAGEAEARRRRLPG